MSGLVKVRANNNVLGMRRNEVAEVELTSAVEGAIRNGYLSTDLDDDVVATRRITSEGIEDIPVEAPAEDEAADEKPRRGRKPAGS